MQRFQKPVTTIEQLAELVGQPSELVLKKQKAELDDYMTTFIGESPFLLLGTFGKAGTCDVSPRGDRHGLAKVLDTKTLVIPDRRGNRRVDSLRNIVETGRVGLLFLIPGLGETLRVNGRACVIQDEDVLLPLAAEGKVPTLGIGVEVEECYFQCAKAILRSGLWAPRDEAPPTALPSFAKILNDQTRIEGQTAETLDRMIAESYAKNLY